MLATRRMSSNSAVCRPLALRSPNKAVCHHRRRIAAQAEHSTSTTGPAGAKTTADAASPPPQEISNTPAKTTFGISNSSPVGLLSSSEQQAAAFGFLSLTSVAFGVVALVAPGLLLSTVLGSDGSSMEVAFTRIAGATMAISAAVERSLQDAVQAGHLKSATYQRLMVAVTAKSTLYLTAFLLSPELWNPVLFSVYPTAAAASIVINVATLQSAFQQAGAASFTEGLQSIWGFDTPKSAASWGYSVAILLYIATVAACYAPEVIFTGEAMTPVGLLLKHTWAPGFLLAAGACYVLKDAADRSRLGASTFRRLNLGLAAVEAGYSAVFGASIVTGLAVSDSSAWSNLAGSLALVMFCGWQYYSNKK